ncbi:MAG TPA: LCP family protein [Anaerolineales bacterium]
MTYRPDPNRQAPKNPYNPYPPQRPGSQPPQRAWYPDEETQPTQTPVYVPVSPAGRPRSHRRDESGGWTRPPRRAGCGCGCLPLGMLGGMLLVFLAVYFLTPIRTNILLLGIDYAPYNGTVSRSDTLILATIIPLKPYVGMLSIPRDLWVNVPGVGENRINTAHFFAEAQKPGSGPAAAMQTIRANFGVDVGYYLRVRFEGFRDVIDAMGGVDIDRKEPAAGSAPGRYHLTGNKALAFVRQRYGSDDFYRMENGQFILKAALRQMFSPAKWFRLPGVMLAMRNALDTNIPFFLWPRLGLAVLRAGPNGIDNRTITREMVVPFTTDQGASVLQPNWSLINPELKQIFGQ